MKSSFALLVAYLIAGCFSGCAYIRSETEDPVVSVATNGVTKIAYKKTLVRAYTLFDSQSALTKFRNTTGQQGTGTNVWSYPPGTAIGGLDQASSSTNLNDILGTIVGAAVSAAKKP